MISSMIGTRSPPSLPRSEPPLSGFTLSPSQSSPPICVLSGIMENYTSQNPHSSLSLSLSLWFSDFKAERKVAEEAEREREMNDLSNALREQDKKRHCWSCKPIPRVAILVLVLLFLLGLLLSIFILVVVHNAAFFLSLLSLSSLVASFLLWNTLNWRRKADLLLYLHSFPDSDLSFAPHAHLVKITGIVMCGSASLESSYEKASRCIYTSTVLYEYGELGLKPVDDSRACFQWRLAYSEYLYQEYKSFWACPGPRGYE